MQVGVIKSGQGCHCFCVVLAGEAPLSSSQSDLLVFVSPIKHHRQGLGCQAIPSFPILWMGVLLEKHLKHSTLPTGCQPEVGQSIMSEPTCLCVHVRVWLVGFWQDHSYFPHMEIQVDLLAKFNVTSNEVGAFLISTTQVTWPRGPQKTPGKRNILI